MREKLAIRTVPVERLRELGVCSAADTTLTILTATRARH
jgi:hypothetical protein